MCIMQCAQRPGRSEQCRASRLCGLLDHSRLCGPSVRRGSVATPAQDAGPAGSEAARAPPLSPDMPCGSPKSVPGDRVTSGVGDRKVAATVAGTMRKSARMSRTSRSVSSSTPSAPPQGAHRLGGLGVLRQPRQRDAPCEPPAAGRRRGSDWRRRVTCPSGLEVIARLLAVRGDVRPHNGVARTRSQRMDLDGHNSHRVTGTKGLPRP